jgi:SAM-dependent methyltransferase
MVRSQTPELMDDPAFAQDMRESFHMELARLNRMLGNDKLVIDRLRRTPPKRVVDIGCGQGALLAAVRSATGAQVLGVDLHGDPRKRYGVEILEADATVSKLPECDVAVSVLTMHHLTENQIVALIRNVRRSAKRFLIVDLVRHPLPLALFSVFVRPWIDRLVYLDGMQSIRRAFTPQELRALVVQGVSGTDAVFEQWVSPVYGKQIIDIDFGN